VIVSGRDNRPGPPDHRLRHTKFLTVPAASYGERQGTHHAVTQGQGPDVQELAVSRVGVVMGVCFPLMLRLGLDVGSVIVHHDRVIVLVGMGGRHVLPLAAMPQVMHHVSVVVGVNDGVMGVLHSDLLVCRAASGTCWPTTLGPGNAAAARTRLAGPVLPLGLVPGTAPARAWRR
jgi:hypothetical protein